MNWNRASVAYFLGTTNKLNCHSILSGFDKKSDNRNMQAVLYILIADIFERLAFFSVVAGLILFCTSNLDINQVNATEISQVFSGFAYLVPILGGFLADSYTGRYRTIFASGVIYLAGVVLIPASSANFALLGFTPKTISERRTLFISGLVLVVLGSGGIKANIGPFGAEQVESRGKEAVQSYFNWFYWSNNVGGLLAFTVAAYVQQEISFTYGFFISTLGILMFFLFIVMGNSKYKKTAPKGSILATACGICTEGICKTRVAPSSSLPEGSEDNFLAGSKQKYGGSYDDHLVDGVASVVKVIPFCFLTDMYRAIYAQMNNSFYAQAERMDVRLGNGVNVPVATLTAFNTIGIIILIPIVDKVVYPFFEYIGKPLTYLKRIGIGMLFAVSAMLVAAHVEINRKKYLKAENGSHVQVLAGQKFTASNMSVFAQIPQFVLIGISEIFASVTVLDFAYNQAPVSMQGLLTGLFLASVGIGSWVSTAILHIVKVATKDDPWWSGEINNAKMENLLFLLAGLMMLNTIVFVVVAHFYTYQDPKRFEPAQNREDGEPDVEESKEMLTDSTSKSYKVDSMKQQRLLNKEIV